MDLSSKAEESKRYKNTGKKLSSNAYKLYTIFFHPLPL